MRWLIVLAAACSGSTTPRAVSRGQWHIVETEHVHVETDLSVDEARTMATALEQELQGLIYLYGMLSTKPAPALRRTQVVLFSDCRSFETVGLGTGTSGYARRSNDLDDAQVIVTCDPTWRDRRFENLRRLQVFRHELSHTLTAYYFGAVPRWLHEGMAEYFEGILFKDDMIELGHPPVGPKGPVRFDDRPITFDELRVASWARTTGRPYHAAWKATYAMFNTSRATNEATLRFLGALASGMSEEAAWKSTLAPVEPAIRKTYQDWKPYAENNYHTIPMPSLAAVTPTVRAMTRVEVAARVVEITIGVSKRGEVAPPLQAALDNLRDADPGGDALTLWRAISAYYVRADSLGRPRDHFADYVARHPEDPRGHHGLVLTSLLEMSAKPDAEREPELAALAPSVAKLVPHATSPAALDVVASYWILRRKPAAALPFVHRALERDPACATCYESLAEIYFQQGKLADAVRTQMRALAGMGDRTVPASMTERLEKFRKALEAGGNPPATP